MPDCQCTILLASLFNPDIRVPAHYIAATVSLCKTCRALKGGAGFKRLKIIEAAKCNEKRIESKVQYMTWSKPKHPPAKEPAQTLVVPEAATLSASDSSDFQVWPCDMTPLLAH